MLRKRRYALLLLALAAVLPSVQAQMGKWPVKPVRMIVGLAPGGGVDIMGRIMAARMSEEFGQQFVVDNRAGAAGMIGADIAAHASPDGYTLTIVGGSYSANAALYELSYDPIKDIAPISIIATGPLVFAVHPSVQATNLKEFIDLARAKPGALAYGSSGVGSTLHLAVELFRQMTNINIVHVPYKGAGPALADLMGAHIQFIFGSSAPTFQQIKAGHLRGIAVTSAHRAPAMPNLPAIGEVVPGYAMDAWYSMWAPAGTPGAIVSRLNQSIARILKEPDMLERLHTDGMEPAHSTPEEYAKVLAQEIAKWSKVVKDGNIKVY